MEVLVALALMAMIATILIASLQIGGHTWQRVMRTTSNTEDIVQAQEFLRRRLAALYPYDHRSADAARPASIISDGRSVEFTSAAPDAVADGMMRYQIAVAADSGMLQVKSRRDRGLNSAEPSDWAVERLLPHVVSFAIQFWAKPEDMPGHWVDQWTDITQTPRLIRIDVAFTPSDNRRWPPLFVEPHVDTPVTCEFDVVSRQCRSGV
jgi:general secretion pathway protein J